MFLVEEKLGESNILKYLSPKCHFKVVKISLELSRSISVVVALFSQNVK